LKIIHTSDIHIASPLSSKLSAAKARMRASEIKETFSRICTGAASVGAEAVIIAGDLFDSERITRADIDSVLSSIASAKGISFFYLSGNHEGDALMEAGVELPENLKLFGDDWTYFNCKGVTIAGRASISSDMYETLNLSENEKNIVVLHGELREYGAEGAIALSELKGKNIDYLALGHYHSYSKTPIDRRGVAVYSGCPEGRGFDEVGMRGVVLLDTDTPASAMLFPFAKRTLDIIKVDATGATSSHELEVKILDAIRVCKADDLIRVSLYGEREIESHWDTALIRKRLEDRFFYFEIKDETKLITRAEDYRFDKSLKGEFIRLCLGDGTLSDREKELIINCGICALAGEVSE
jgi:DNA repair exonuclease SbcCD nuclease subunit